MSYRMKAADVLKILTQQTKKQRITILDLPDDLKEKIVMIYKYLHKYKLRDWVPLKLIRWEFLSENPNAIDFLSLPKNRVHINWEFLSENPEAVDFISLPENKKHIDYRNLSGNPNPKAIELLKERLKVNPRIVDWKALSKNPYAIELLILPENNEKIDWSSLSGNIEAIDILKDEYKKENNRIDWKALSENPSAIDILKEEYKKKKNKINWKALSRNPNAIDIINEEYRRDKKNKINWKALSGNPNAIELLLSNVDKIDWPALSYNPNAIDLLKCKIINQINLQANEIKNLQIKERINWMGISSNPSIFIAI